MNLGNLIPGTLIKRYKRFFADVKLDSGEVVVAHTPNTGPMTSCFEKGWKCLLSHNPDPKRKLKYTLQFTYNGTTWIGVNTHLTNQIAKESLTKGLIPELSKYNKITSEYTIGQSRLDFLLEDDNGDKCYVETKNVSLVDGFGHGMFPDTVSTRATKHLKELIEIKKKGFRTVVLLLAQREDIKSFSPNDVADPDFARAFNECLSIGVEVLVYKCKIDFPEVSIGEKIPIK